LGLHGLNAISGPVLIIGMGQSLWDGLGPNIAPQRAPGRAEDNTAPIKKSQETINPNSLSRTTLHGIHGTMGRLYHVASSDVLLRGRQFDFVPHALND
jgi:hypothetical protein